jgi:SAM-dependent methyltransferase
MEVRDHHADTHPARHAITVSRPAAAMTAQASEQATTPASTPASTPTSWPVSGDWAGWAATWEARMQAFFPHRSACVAAVMDVLTELLPAGPWRILDLGAGTGSLSGALIERFPEAQVVALDLDPVLMAIGQGTHGDAGSRLGWRQVNLRDANWPDLLEPGASPAATFDAVVSLATLHHFSGAETDRIYRSLAGLLKPGGVLLNAEALPAAPTSSRLSVAFHEARRRTMVPHDGFWDAIAADAALVEAVTAREALRGQMHGAGQRLTAEAHLRALRRAGFAEAAVAWRHLDEALVVGLR